MKTHHTYSHSSCGSACLVAAYYNEALLACALKAKRPTNLRAFFYKVHLIVNSIYLTVIANL